MEDKNLQSQQSQQELQLNIQKNQINSLKNNFDKYIQSKQEKNQINQRENYNIEKFAFRVALQRLIDEVQTHDFNLNEVIRHVQKKLQNYQQSYKIKLEQKQISQIKSCIQRLIIQASKLPSIFMMLLENQKLTSSSLQINLLQSTQDIIRTFWNNFLDKLKQSDQVHNKIYKYISLGYYKQNDEIFRQLIKAMATQIKANYDYCKIQIMQKYLESFESIGQNSKILNVYLMYKILRQISFNSKKLIEEHLIEGVFRYCQDTVLHKFSHYIMEKFEVIQFKICQNIEHDKKLQKQIVDESILILKKLESNKSIQMTTRIAVSRDGQCAIFIKSYQSDKQKNQEEKNSSDYLIKINSNSVQSKQIFLIRCETIRKSWFTQRQDHHFQNLSDQAFYLIEKNQKLLNSKYIANKQDQIFDFEHFNRNNKMIHIDDLTNTGGTLGKCLADISRYSNATDFLKDISQRAILTHGFNTIFQRIPILGYLFIAGSLSYSFYSVMKNKMKSSDKKLKEFGNLAIVASTSVGTSIAGGLIGQILIPIPVVGALIGTVIGGFLGERGSRKLTNFMEKRQFLNLIKYLKNQQIKQKYWIVNKQILDQIGLSKNQFYKQIPQKMTDSLFLTMICFVLVCFYQSTNQRQYNKKLSQQKKQLTSYSLKMHVVDQQQQAEQDLSYIKDAIIESQHINSMRLTSLKQKQKSELSDEQRLQLEILSMSGDKQYSTQFDLKAMINYLDENQVQILRYMDLLEKIMIPFLQKIK